MKIINCNYDIIDKKIQDIVSNGLDDDYAILSSKPEGTVLVSLGQHSKLTEKDLIDKSHVLLKQDRLGGTLVTFKDGITVWFITESRVPPLLFVSRIVQYLKYKNLNAEIKGNDILVDGYKVSGNFEKYIGSKRDTLFGMHISLNVDLDVIKHYCDKEMNKIPKGLSEYGITREELLDVFYKFVDEQNE